MNPFVSIVVCTYNRHALLGDCLQSLERQSAEKSQYEVIIVNNNSKDSTLELAHEYAARNKNFKVCTETRQGLSYARNRGFEESSSDWIAYIDDDARAFPDYVDQLTRFVEQHSDVSCFGGPCVPLYHQSKPQWYLDAYQTGKLGDARIMPLGEHDFVSGFNIVFNKQKLVDLNGFNPLIGMTGRKVAYGEETQVQVKIRQSGGQVFFVADLLVHHYIDSYKLRFWWFFKSSFANGRDSWETFEQVPTLRDRWRSLRSAIDTPLRKFPSSWERFRTGEYRLQNLLIECFAPASWYLGRMFSRVQDKGRVNVSTSKA